MRRSSKGRDGRLTTDAGYTLTEILVVMAVIGLIAAVLTPGVVGHLGRARAKTAQMQLENISAGLEMFRSDVGRYPSSTEGLAVLLAQPADAEGWTGPYLKNNKALRDPWGSAVSYDVSEDGLGYSVISFGADGREGGFGLNRDLQAPGS